MRRSIRVGYAAVALLAMACSGKLVGAGADGGEGDAQATGSSGGNGGVSCGGGNGSSNGGSNGGSSGGSGASSSGIGSSSGTGSGSSGGSGSSSGGINCGAMPTLHPNPPGDIYCGLGADGGALDCLASAGDGMCCLGGMVSGTMYAPETCSPNAMVGCDNGGGDGGLAQPIGIQCNQVADCTANGMQGTASCCLQGASAPAIVPGCGYLKSRGGNAVVCEVGNVCAPGEVQICSSNADCPQGTTCTPGKWKIFQVGFCQ